MLSETYLLLILSGYFNQNTTKIYVEEAEQISSVKKDTRMEEEERGGRENVRACDLGGLTIL